ncbi:uncharacterized protein MEPE_02539 [Melanopsichium pennsylvanicum]|uniref:Uncharacterized protein n=1 Tax=Melanopsichium pennsylvanicum TaxID=63383 RepID=A0AAJ4XL93_9BASI|nr:uncharacterized protein MEPE_02539 [Melanopsichium pennsylvanicum]
MSRGVVATAQVNDQSARSATALCWFCQPHLGLCIDSNGRIDLPISAASDSQTPNLHPKATHFAQNKQGAFSNGRFEAALFSMNMNQEIHLYSKIKIEIACVFPKRTFDSVFEFGPPLARERKRDREKDESDAAVLQLILMALNQKIAPVLLFGASLALFLSQARGSSTAAVHRAAVRRAASAALAAVARVEPISRSLIEIAHSWSNAQRPSPHRTAIRLDVQLWISPFVSLSPTPLSLRHHHPPIRTILTLRQLAFYSITSIGAQYPIKLRRAILAPVVAVYRHSAANSTEPSHRHL